MRSARQDENDLSATVEQLLVQRFAWLQGKIGWV
jgi:hypothetical protein